MTHDVVGKSYTNRRLGLTLQKVILRTLIKPNQLIIRSYLQNFNCVVWVFFVVRSVPDLAILGRFRNAPMAGEETQALAGSGIFSRISTTGNGVVKKVRAVLQ